MQFTIQNQKQFIDNLKKVKLFMSTEITRYYLMGVCFHLIDNKLHIVATDGHRLLRINLGVMPDDARDGETLSAIVPAEAIKTLISVKKLEDEMPVVATFYNTQAVFDFLEIKVTTKLIDGTFPDYEHVIPTPEKSQENWGLKGKYLKDVLSVFGDNAVRFQYQEDGGAVIINGGDERITAVLMPMRV